MNQNCEWRPTTSPPLKKKIHQLPTPQPYSSQPIRKWQQKNGKNMTPETHLFHVLPNVVRCNLSWFFSNQSFLNHAHGIPCHSLSLKSPFESTLWLGYSCVAGAGWIGWIDAPSARPQEAAECKGVPKSSPHICLFTLVSTDFWQFALVC